MKRSEANRHTAPLLYNSTEFQICLHARDSLSFSDLFVFGALCPSADFNENPSITTSHSLTIKTIICHCHQLSSLSNVLSATANIQNIQKLIQIHAIYMQIFIVHMTQKNALEKNTHFPFERMRSALFFTGFCTYL